jgi:hypothetical protein
MSYWSIREYTSLRDMAQVYAIMPWSYHLVIDQMVTPLAPDPHGPDTNSRTVSIGVHQGGSAEDPAMQLDL